MEARVELYHWRYRIGASPLYQFLDNARVEVAAKI